MQPIEEDKEVRGLSDSDLVDMIENLLGRKVEKIKSYLRQAWLVIILSVCSAGGLAGIQQSLQARIEYNRTQETLSQIPRLVPGIKLFRFLRPRGD